ncbi:glycosyltransferase family 4 protein [Vibrio breoganii]
MKKKLYIVTTVPQTLFTILKGQPEFLHSAYDITLISSGNEKGYDLERIAKNEGVKWHRVDMYRGISPARDVVSIFTLAKFLCYNRPEIIHSFTPKAGFIVSIASFIARVKKRVHTFTGLIFPTEYGLKKYLLKNLDKLVVALNTNIVCEGKGVWRQLSDAGFNDKKFEIIGNGNIAGVDVDHFCKQGLTSSVESNLKLDKNVPVFLYVGRLNKDKGISELVNAFIELNFEANLIIVGALDDTAPIDNQTMKIIQDNNNIYNVGFQCDVRPYMSVANCLILPSYREGFPNVLLQAGSMELASIVTDVPGSNEAIIDGYNGWIVPPRSTSALIDAMYNFNSLSTEEKRTISRNSRINVVSKYERSIYQAKLTEFYYNLCLEKDN